MINDRYQALTAQAPWEPVNVVVRKQRSNVGQGRLTKRRIQHKGIAEY